jgi:hypothetical protein
LASHQRSLGRFVVLFSILFAIELSSACNRDSGISTGPSSPDATNLAEVRSVRITRERSELGVGDTQHFTVEVDLGPGVPPSSAAPLWVSSNPAVLNINASGIASAVAVGGTTLQVTFLGRTATRRVQIVPR